MSNIHRIFLALFLFLNNIIIPKPAFTNKPDNNAPNERLPSMNSSLKSNEDAQLGIKPIIDANNGPNKVSSDIKKAVAPLFDICKDCIL